MDICLYLYIKIIKIMETWKPSTNDRQIWQMYVFFMEKVSMLCTFLANTIALQDPTNYYWE